MDERVLWVSGDALLLLLGYDARPPQPEGCDSNHLKILCAVLGEMEKACPMQ